MVSLLTKLAAVLALLSLLAWVVWLRPIALGGATSYIIIQGQSMEPKYHQGDLVLTRKAPSYDPGDIVAYPTADYFQSGRVVIHRIIGKDATGLITQGDNNDFIDKWRPTEEQVHGAAWLHIPMAGGYLAQLSEAGNLRVFFVAMLLLFVAGGAEANRMLGQRRKPTARAVYISTDPGSTA